MVDPNAPIWYLSDGQCWWGPYTLAFMQTNPPPQNLTHIWAPGMPNWEPITRVLQVGGVTVQITGDSISVNIQPPGGLRFGGQHWPRGRK